ncbi:hypothetical protein SJAV_18840 [Sulfurisphaera javensis]|uniref:Uncharacterized protein n=1 Tax=Sulfurisphaera javensis TaxID=2049879 RepID=A0AAT9GSZ7_9CREN
MQGDDERRIIEKNIKEIVYSVSFIRPIPKDMFFQIFLTNSMEVNIKGTKITAISDERNIDFIKEITFMGSNVQQWVEYFLLSLKEKFSLKVEDVIWSYEVYLEIENNVKLNLNIPSVLPLIGNVTNYGIVITNDPDFKMMLRNFTTVQIDKRIRVIKRSESFIDINNLLSDLEKLLEKIKT